ncbi:MAG: DUF2079 domain-containing protein [Acidimicrobiales bacterium]
MPWAPVTLDPVVLRARQLGRALQRPWVVLGAMVAAYVAVFGSLTWSQQSNFGTFGFDMGIYDQGIWLVSRFRTPFLTVRGLNYFAHHVNIVTLLIVPAYWLGAGPHLLYLVETVVLAGGAIPLWLLARDRLANPWAALALPAAYLLYPSTEWINWWHFHPDALIITPLLFAYWLATRQRWGWYVVAVAVALSCKEDAALAVAMMGIVVWLKFGRRRAGVATTVAGIAWFGVCTKLIIPLANGGRAPFYAELFPGFGSSIPEIVWTMVRHPSRLLRLATRHDRFTYYAQLLWPVGLLCLLEAPVLSIGLPQLMVNVSSGHGYTHDIKYHYSAIVIAGVFLATVEACGRYGRTESGRRFLAGLVLASALASNVAWSPSPIGVKYHSGIWARPVPKHRALRDALHLVPRGASVAATYYIVPHLTHRTLIYEFPNPWVTANWGAPGSRPADPAPVDWMVLDTSLNGDQAKLYNALIAREFAVVFDRSGVVVAHRVQPGVPNFHGY